MSKANARVRIDELAGVVRTAVCLRGIRACEMLRSERAGETYDAAHAWLVISK